ncbi:hypothetical protein COCNU_04G014150 [Cocos nucifera]|uniref:Uncharacterized protein n=1 Tax=Cocos nucifera TaxID=13894 RepID=A0A8K0N1C2_COCNU|nr:hypothetical protein COCNU_04G014150 [Cocos nucifera]
MLKMIADEVLIDKFMAKSHAGQEFAGRDETIDLTQSSKQVGDNMKDSMSDETEVVSPNKTSLKRLVAESIIKANVDGGTLENDHTAQISNNKMKKTIKIEKD